MFCECTRNSLHIYVRHSGSSEIKNLLLSFLEETIEFIYPLMKNKKSKILVTKNLNALNNYHC